MNTQWHNNQGRVAPAIHPAPGAFSKFFGTMGEGIRDLVRKETTMTLLTAALIPAIFFQTASDVNHYPAKNLSIFVNENAQRVSTEKYWELSNSGKLYYVTFSDNVPSIFVAADSLSIKGLQSALSEEKFEFSVSQVSPTPSGIPKTSTAVRLEKDEKLDFMTEEDKTNVRGSGGAFGAMFLFMFFLAAHTRGELLRSCRRIFGQEPPPQLKGAEYRPIS